MAQFLLSCESTVEYMHSCGIPVIFYSYIVDEQAYPDDMGRDPEALPRFYAFLDAGKLPSTSQINQFAYRTMIILRACSSRAAMCCTSPSVPA